MKQLFRLLFLLIVPATAFSQQASEPYAAAYTRVDSLLATGLPQSARKVVDSIYQQASRKADKVQVLKAQLYLFHITTSDQEEGDSASIAYAEQKAQTTTFPEQAIWQSIAAQAYWNYYTRDRWQILNRTTVADTSGTDFEQWDAAKFVARTSWYYRQSLSQAEALKRINIEAYDPILDKGINTRSYRPTLFDLLAFRAIDFFENDEKDLTRPAYQFVMDDAAAFAPANEFIQHRFQSKDTASMHWQALQLYQQALRLHQPDAQPDALLDADLQRLEFAYRSSVLPDKDSLYRNALADIELRYSDHPLSALAGYRRLMVNANENPPVRPLDVEETPTTPKKDLVALRKKLEAIAARFPESEGGILAKQYVQNELLDSYLNITTEEAVLPDEPSKFLVNYKNVPKLFVRVVKVDFSQRKRLDMVNLKTAKWLVSMPATYSFDASLPGTEDLRDHTTEVAIKDLPRGLYAILYSTKENFDTVDNIMGFAVFQVTGLAVVNNNDENTGLNSYLLDRKNGMPVAGARVDFTTTNSNNKPQKLSQTTNSEGLFQFRKKEEEYRYYYGEILAHKDGDTFYRKNYGGYYTSNHSDDEAEEKTIFFTDRSIYRPGQTVYYKGIVFKADQENRKADVMKGYKETIYLYDPNGTELDSANITTNEFGSFSGAFVLPQGTLTGDFTIEDDNDEIEISVEEYKRPKFSVSFDTLKKEYALNENVTVTGRAVAYAGNNIDGATVKYRVVRNTRWPVYYSGWARSTYSPQQQLAQGTTTTQADGSFNIAFQTLPNRTIQEDALPAFTYTIYADVTDVNGETHSASQYMSAGYRSLEFTLNIPDRGTPEELDRLLISTRNLNGQFVPATVKLRIVRLQQPAQLYRKRLWPAPNQYSIDSLRFRQLFPLDEYRNESDPRFWNKAETVTEKTVTTTVKGIIELPASTFSRNGNYVLELETADKNGKKIKEKRYLEVWSPKNAGRTSSPLVVSPVMRRAEPGETAQVYAASGFDKAHILQFQQSAAQSQTKQLTFSGKPLLWSQTITEGDRGDIAVSFLTLKENRVYFESKIIDVPWTNKQLDITWETHRDKLQPGAAETWTLVVKGKNKDKIAAEMVASLYDASLDALKPHDWIFPLPGEQQDVTGNFNWTIGTDNGNGVVGQSDNYAPSFEKLYDAILSPSVGEYARTRDGSMVRYASPMIEATQPGSRSVFVADGILQTSARATNISEAIQEKKGVVSSTNTINYITNGIVLGEVAPPLRKNLQETAFFFPQLKTDSERNVRLSFTMPEALTEWKLMAFAHTKDMATGSFTGSVKTQKDLMVVPGLPRFLRQGDDLVLSTKISNLSDRELSGTATLELVDAQTLKPLALPFRVQTADKAFTVVKGQSTTASWSLHVPESLYNPVLVRISARSGNFTDGEENTLPVLSNRRLVTETLPIWMNGDGTKTFSFDKLLHSDTSKTLSQHSLTIEYTGNPAWYAIQSLPYLMEFPYECAEQTFNRYYANALAAHILAKAPKVQAIFRQWETVDTAALLSNLEKNQELKTALLEETPWVMEAKNETEQKHRIALLFNAAKLSRDLADNARKLRDMQLPDGGFPWFKGDSRADRYITQYIVSGIGRMFQLGLEDSRGDLNAIVAKALPYLNKRVQESYNDLIKNKAKLDEQHIGHSEANYLYMRSFFLQERPVNKDYKVAYTYYQAQAKKYWPKFNAYQKGAIALALSRQGDNEAPKTILQSLRETSKQKEELGMYWPELQGRSWWWYEAPIEAQSLLIECFQELANDQTAVNNMRRWLLRQKQTQNWGTTKATADACYALLSSPLPASPRGGGSISDNFLLGNPEISIQLGDTVVRSGEQKTQAGTGYFSIRFDGSSVKPQMGTITLTTSTRTTTTQNTSSPLGGGREGAAPSWGAIYWQYFENLDKITAAQTPLTIRKQLFIERNTDRGVVLEPITGTNSLKVGEKVKARIEITADRDMEYVHLKDQRGSCFEPVNVLSGYRWQGGLGYYESTRDASSNFFFSYLPKGKYVFEYPMFVTHTGAFSNGIATLQCMYAPEFSAHSAGMRVVVK